MKTAAEDRVAQGLPPKITNPTTLARIAHWVVVARERQRADEAAQHNSRAAHQVPDHGTAA
jgi:hypothetical protein